MELHRYPINYYTRQAVFFFFVKYAQPFGPLPTLAGRAVKAADNIRVIVITDCLKSLSPTRNVRLTVMIRNLGGPLSLAPNVLQPVGPPNSTERNPS